MTGLPLIPPDTATGQTAELFDAVQRAHGVTSNMTQAMANSPAVLKGYLEFSGALAAGNLSAGTRERIALLVAQENGCDYCLSAHTFSGTKLAGLTDADAAQARRGQADDPKAGAALRLAAALIHARGAVADSEFDPNLSHGEIAEVVAHVALNVFTNYLNKAGRVAIDWPLVRHTD